MIQNLWLMYNTTSDIFIFCTLLPFPPTPLERIDLLLHFTSSSYIPFHWWCQPSPSDKAVAFNLQSPWVKHYGVTNSESAIHGHISDEVTQTASQPYDYSILNSFQIKSRVIIYWWLEREKPLCLNKFILSEIKTSLFQFHLLCCCWNEAAKSTDDVQQCPLWAKQNFRINRWKGLAQLIPWAPWNRRAFFFVHFLPSQITSGWVMEILLQRHMSLLQAKQALDRNHMNMHFCAIKQHHRACFCWQRGNHMATYERACERV